MTHGPADDGSVYLTFDDGPNAQYTPLLLDLLATHRAKASFFLVGDQIEANAPLVDRMIAEGHLIGNHSFSHPHFGRLSLKERLAEIERVDQMLTRFDGRESHLFRPPRGELQLLSLLHFALNRRRVAFWSYDSLDYQKQSPDEVIAVLRRDPPRAGDIVLMHDDSGAAAKVLEAMLPEWAAAGLKFSSLPPASAPRVPA